MIEDKVMRWTIKILSIVCGLLVLFTMVGYELEPLTDAEHIRLLRHGAMLGFMVWLFTYVSTLLPPKTKEK